MTFIIKTLPPFTLTLIGRTCSSRTTSSTRPRELFMKEFLPVLHTAALFSGISDDELAPLGVLASADNPVSHGASGFCRWKKQLRSVETGRTASARTI